MDENKYNEFIKTIEIQDVFLSKMISNRLLTSFNNLPEPIVNVEFVPKFKLDKIENDKFICNAEFQVSARVGKEVMFNIACEFTIINSIEDPTLMEEDLINKYIEYNLPMIAWPYGRELINSTTTRMGLPPLIIGTRKIV